EIALGDLFLSPAEEAPDGIRRRIAVSRLEIHALAGRGQLEAAGADPVHQLTYHGRLVAIRHAVDEVFGPGARGQKRTTEHVRLHVDHDQVLAAVDGRERMPHARDRVTSRLDDALDLRE